MMIGAPRAPQPHNLPLCQIYGEKGWSVLFIAAFRFALAATPTSTAVRFFRPQAWQAAIGPQPLSPATGLTALLFLEGV